MGEPLHAWMERAACRGADPEMFWPEKGEMAGPALAVCDRCPVVDHCFEFVMSQTVEPGGVWGGTTERQRRRMRGRREA